MSGILLVGVLLGHAIAGGLLGLSSQVSRCRMRWSAVACGFSSAVSLVWMGISLARQIPAEGLVATVDVAPGLAFGLQGSALGSALAASTSLAATTAVAWVAVSRVHAPARTREMGLGLWMLVCAMGVLLAATVSTVYTFWGVGAAVSMALAVAAGSERWAAKLALAAIASIPALVGVAAALRLAPADGSLASLERVPSLGWLAAAVLLLGLALGSWGLPWKGEGLRGVEGVNPQWLAFASSGPGLYVLAAALGYGELGQWSAWRLPLLLAATGLLGIAAVQQLVARDLSAWLDGARRSGVGLALAGLVVGHPAGLLALLLSMIDLTLCGTGASLGLRSYIEERGLVNPPSKKGLLKRLVLGYSALSLAGVPPLLGFTSRWLLMVACLETGNSLLALVAIGCLAVSPLSLVGQLRLCPRLAGSAPLAEDDSSATGLALVPITGAAVALSLALLTPGFQSISRLALGAVGTPMPASGHVYSFAWLALLSVVGAALASGVTGTGDRLGERFGLAIGQWRRRLIKVERNRRRAVGLLISRVDLAELSSQIEERHYLAAVLLIGTMVIVYCLGY